MELSEGRPPGWRWGRKLGRRRGQEGSSWWRHPRCGLRRWRGVNHRLQPHRRTPLRSTGCPWSCPRRPGLSFSHCELINPSFSILFFLFLVFSLFTPLPLSFSVSLQAHPYSPLQDPLGKLGPVAQGLRGRAGHLAPRPGGRWLRKLRTNPGVRPAPQPCPRHPLISSCHLPMLPLWKSHQRSRSRLPPSVRRATAGPGPFQGPSRARPAPWGYPRRPRPSSN